MYRILIIMLLVGIANATVPDPLVLEKGARAVQYMGLMGSSLEK